jgi:hypothetical protein
MAAGAYQERVQEFNARMAEKQADLIIQKSAKDANQVRLQGDQVLGKQRVNFAAQGIDINSGSALAIQDETVARSKEDARTVINNAYLEAIGIRYDAVNQRSQGGMARVAANARANTSLINGGIEGALTYARLSR